MTGLTTSIATSDAGSITIRDMDLVSEIIGKHGFVAMIYRHLSGRFPTEAETALVDACLVTLMEHGITPSSLIARLMIDSVPDQLQVAVASGLNAVGSVFVGTMEGCGTILTKAVAAKDRDALLRSIVAEHGARREPLPGFGHPFHKPDDPRTPRLLDLAREVELHGSHCDALLRLSAIADETHGRHLTINATGAVAALLLEAGLDPSIFRGIAVISRSAGLVTHVQEERLRPTARRLWSLADEAISYVPKK